MRGHPSGSGARFVRTLWRTIIPHRPVAELITDGVYWFSRNPMYAGLVIKPEETNLAERYGSVYAEYRLRVRRWIRVPTRLRPA